jgi:hypothetical protein
VHTRILTCTYTRKHGNNHIRGTSIEHYHAADGAFPARCFELGDDVYDLHCNNSVTIVLQQCDDSETIVALFIHCRAFDAEKLFGEMRKQLTER